MPTASQLKSEIESGPLAAELATHWAAVFPTETEPAEGTPAHARWLRIRGRFGMLTPDAVHGLLKSLNDPTKRTRSVPRKLDLVDLPGAGFDTASLAAVFVHPRYAEFRDVIKEQNHTGAVAMAVMFRALNVVTQADLDAFTSYSQQTTTVPCSRLTELGWAVTESDLQAAKKL